MSLAAHCHRIVVVHLSSSPSHRHDPIVDVVLEDVNVDVVVVIVIVVVVITSVVFHFIIGFVAITAIIVVGANVVAVAVARRPRACCAPWLSNQGILPKQAKAVSLMAWGWSASPWICRWVERRLRHCVGTFLECT